MDGAAGGASRCRQPHAGVFADAAGADGRLANNYSLQRKAVGGDAGRADASGGGFAGDSGAAAPEVGGDAEGDAGEGLGAGIYASGAWARDVVGGGGNVRVALAAPCGPHHGVTKEQRLVGIRLR